MNNLNWESYNFVEPPIINSNFFNSVPKNITLYLNPISKMFSNLVSVSASQSKIDNPNKLIKNN